MLFYKYLVDISSEAWLNLFLEYVNVKLLAVYLLTETVCSYGDRRFQNDFKGELGPWITLITGKKGGHVRCIL
jgi:hypothetical protein